MTEILYACIFCNEVDVLTNLQRVKCGFDVLVKNCQSLGKQDAAERLWSAKEDDSQIHVHNSCRKELVNDLRDKSGQCVQSGYADDPLSKKRKGNRMSNIAFDWKEQCFVCEKLCDSRETWHLCVYKHPSGPQYTRDTMLAYLANKTDDLSNSVRGRLLTISDLPAEEARYHNYCKNKLFLSQSSKTKRGRPSNEKQANVFLKLCDWFEKECDIVTLKALHEKMFELAKESNDPDQAYSSAQYLKQKLREKYRYSIFFTERSGVSDVVCLRDTASTILNDAWYENRKTNANEESERIIRTAAKLILAQIKTTEYNIDHYPDNETIKDISSNIE